MDNWEEKKLEDEAFKVFQEANKAAGYPIERDISSVTEALEAPDPSSMLIDWAKESPDAFKEVVRKINDNELTPRQAGEGLAVEVLQKAHPILQKAFSKMYSGDKQMDDAARAALQKALVDENPAYAAYGEDPKKFVSVVGTHIEQIIGDQAGLLDSDEILKSWGIEKPAGESAPEPTGEGEAHDGD